MSNSNTVQNCLACASNIMKDDGTGKCVDVNGACSTGYMFNGDSSLGLNCYACTVGYKNNG